jgi:hypothetical protein
MDRRAASQTLAIVSLAVQCRPMAKPLSRWLALHFDASLLHDDVWTGIDQEKVASCDHWTMSIGNLAASLPKNRAILPVL